MVYYKVVRAGTDIPVHDIFLDKDEAYEYAKRISADYHDSFFVVPVSKGGN
jgi:hypothetical protein